MATIKGDSGNNVLDGTDDDDIIYGYEGNDTIEAGDGDDVIDAGSGVDDISGEAGADFLVVSSVTIGFPEPSKTHSMVVADTIHSTSARGIFFRILSGRVPTAVVWKSQTTA